VPYNTELFVQEQGVLQMRKYILRSQVNECG
jgi:hypothetical protein